MMSFLTCITGFFMNFELFPILTDYAGTIPARFGLIWFSGFREEDLNVIFYQNMPNLHNRYISAERKISQKNPEYMLNCSILSQNVPKFELCKHNDELFSIYYRIFYEL
jgi:hypothetical protein